MGRKRSANSNLPDRMLARKRTRKNGKTTVYYYYDGREDGRRKEIPLPQHHFQRQQCRAQAV